MLFNSYAFIFAFLPVVFAGMFAIARRSHRLAALWLAMASLTFYAFWDARFLLLLLCSIAFNYGAGYWIGLRRANGKAALCIAIAGDLMLLGYFKYVNFFVSSVNQLSGGHIPAPDIILPLGISFFTFTQIAFLVDVYRGIAREYDFVHYLLFVTYFPHLIAGPILHHKQMMPQFATPASYRINPTHVAAGLSIFMLGLSKKVLIADNLAEIATPIFNAVQHGLQPMLFEAWSGALAYSLQLYFDFSGYSDMAVGLSLMFNIRLPVNFDSPYKAASIIDFWRRWHMTLSAFLREYLYIPLGGNRKGPSRRYANLMATMLLGGLWHGAGWTYVAWGGLHGLYLLINHAWRNMKARLGWELGGTTIAARALTFVAVVVAWVFFRADSFPSAWAILSGMAGANGISLPVALGSRLAPLSDRISWLHIEYGGLLPSGNVRLETVLIGIAVSLTLVWLFPNMRQIFARYNPVWEDMNQTPPLRAQPPRLSWRPTPLYAWVCGTFFALCILSLTRVTEFIYFQF